MAAGCRFVNGKLKRQVVVELEGTFEQTKQLSAIERL